ncbi:phosphatase PAP2 family protein [Pontibacter diazotrophicus]|uniref:Phosphatase PAP2 family protein n=1 Tax=Pontibacter diazotrophicus TaxID=1400979 RepID=A0A3D8LE21_9BACT|nr:phosphatase PAP2 family protein [Pontibacter diazotrophicus]RDV15650.1 phosphatase PAP2 family protein [Pontibacter diazotrophicus]
MKRILAVLTLFTFLAGEAYSQDNSPYKTSFKVDAPIIVAGMGLTYYGLTRMQDKNGLTEEEVANLNKNDVNRFDRFSAGWDSESADNLSDFPFYGSFVAPLALLLDEDVKSNAGQVFVLYWETMAVTGAFFTMANGHVERVRPNAYSPDVSLSEKMRSNTKNAFYGGHNSATAGATFFAAKVFHDFNPDSPARHYVWAAAATVPAVVGYMRMRAGKHFLSDVIIGYVVGAGAGILVPQLHKKSNNTNLSLFPVAAPDYRGAALSYTF